MKAAAAARADEGMPLWARMGLAAGVIALFLAAVTMLPLPIPPYLDFQVLYQTDMALLRGISPYDHAGQVNMIAQLAHVSPEQVYALPFPYSPWYALSTVWLAWLPIEAAVRLWLGISLLLLVAAMWLLTDGWSMPKRLLALGLAIFFLPVLGSLAVGQYGFVVLLGAALMVHALRHDRPLLAAVAAGLLTFKPHIGALIMLAVFIYLWEEHSSVARRTLLYILGAGAGLFALGFLADNAWPANYIRSLLAFRQDSGVATCGLCASLPALLLSRVPGGASLIVAAGLGVFILILLIAVWLFRGGEIMQGPFRVVASAILVVLLSSPYLLNYDFVLMLVPLALLAGGQRKPVEWLLLAIAYVMPFIGLGLWSRQGNFVLPLCAGILLVMLYRDRQQLDVRGGEA